MNVSETMAQIVPTWRAGVVIISVATGGVMAGVGAVLGFGDYADLPEDLSYVREDVAVLQGQQEEADSAISALTAGLAEIVCLVTLTATGEVLTPLEVSNQLARVRRGESCP